MSLGARSGARIPHPTVPLCPGGFRERFVNGLDPYSIVSGSVFQLNPGDIYGTSLSLLGGPILAVGATAFRNDLATDGITNVKFKVRVDFLPNNPPYPAPDDGPTLEFGISGGATRLNFTVAREKVFDADQRAQIAFNGGVYQAIGSTHLVVGVWYQVEVDSSSGTGAVVTITNLTTGVVFATLNFASPVPPYDYTQLLFSQTFSFGSGTLPGATYADILLC